jgi:transcriptional regulator with XRE-family HTH domain
MKIGDKIKALRAKKDISQQDLAKAIGVSDQAISAWENNKKVPRMGSVEKLSAFFNVPKSFLIEDDLGLDKIAVPAAATAAGFILGGPVLASLMGVLTSVGALANTMDAHLDNGVKREHPAPFLMTKNDEEKEVLRIFRELSPENKNTIMLLLKSLAQQKAPSEDGEDFSENRQQKRTSP